jgi:hypothetical protein
MDSEARWSAVEPDDWIVTLVDDIKVHVRATSCSTVEGRTIFSLHLDEVKEFQVVASFPSEHVVTFEGGWKFSPEELAEALGPNAITRAVE